MSDACTWTEAADGNWQTDCDHMFCLYDGTPKENHLAFCGYCGRKLEEARFDLDGDE